MKGYQVTLTTANTVYNLLTLIRAIDSAFVDTANAGDVVVQVEDDGGAQKVLLGDANVAANRYAWKGTIGDTSPHYGSVGGLNARSDTNSTKLNISVGYAHK